MNLGRYAGALVMLACLTFSAATLADTRDIEFANNQVSAQFQSHDMNYTEIANGSLLNTEDAEISGWGLSASAMKDLWFGHDYFALQFGFAYGQSRYIGGTLGNPTYGSNAGTSGAKLKNFNFRYGKGYVVETEIMVTPYGELGYHQYDRTLGYGTPGSYLEKYAHRHFGIGVMPQISLGDDLVWSAYALIGRTFGASTVVGLPAPLGFTARLGNSTLYSIGASIDYALSRNLHANIGVDCTSWKYGASAPHLANGTALYEPDSKTNYTIVRAGIGYAF